MRRADSAYLLAALWLVAAHPAGAASSFAGLGDLPGGPVYTLVWGISADGTVAVGSATDASANRPVRWEAGVLDAIGPQPGHPWTFAQATSSDGSVVTGGRVRWDEGVVSIVLDSFGQFALQVQDVSADGSVMVGTGGAPFRSEGGTAVELLLPIGLQSQLSWAISADGSVIAGTADNGGNGQAAIRWEGGVSTVLPHAAVGGSGPVSSQAYGISADASVITGVTAQRPVFWDAGGARTLPLLGSFTAATALDASADGMVIVGASGTYGSGSEVATVWDGAGPRLLTSLLADAGVSVAGWQLGAIEGVSDDGLTMVGQGINPSGQQEAWIARVERPIVAFACGNGLDDDGDGTADFPADPGCASPATPTETSACQNGLDDDSDGGIDFDGGASLNGGTPIAVADSLCTNGWKVRENPRPPRCGLGAELALAVFVLRGARQRISRPNSSGGLR